MKISFLGRFISGHILKGLEKTNWSQIIKLGENCSSKGRKEYRFKSEEMAECMTFKTYSNDKIF